MTVGTIGSDRPGEALQQLVRLIEIGVANNANVTVVSPARLRDLDTGRLREHDVLVTIREAHHQVLVALECRDRSRKVGVPEVEAFSAKCKRTGVDKGIIVSSLGFTDTARLKAKAQNIGCYALQVLPGVEWIKTDSLQHVQRQLVSVDVRFRLSGGAKPDLATSTMFFGDGTLLDRDRLKGLALHGLSLLVPDDSSLEPEASDVIYLAAIELEVNEDNVPYVIDADECRHDVLGGLISVGYRNVISSRPLIFHEYLDLLAEVGITTVAISSFELDKRPAHIVFVSNIDGTKTLKIVVDGQNAQTRSDLIPRN